MTEEAKKIPEEVFRYVERKLYDYKANLALIEEYEQERQSIGQRYRQLTLEQASGNPYAVSDPTSQRTIRLLILEEKAEQAMRAVRPIQRLWTTFSQEERDILEYRYFRNAAYSTNKMVIAMLNMDKNRYYELRNEIIRKLAIAYGIL